MVFVVLCGGLGTRMAQGTFPKPLTPILGSPSIKFALQHVAPTQKELIFIYASHLSVYNFEEVILNLFKMCKITFTCVPFGTRGAVETALAGLLQLNLAPATPLVFLDNDNVYSAELAVHSEPSQPFLGYDFDHSDSVAMSFMRCAPDGSVVDFAEKKRISDQFGTGVYGFSSVAQFLQWGRYTLQHGPFPKNEVYMSSIYVNMLRSGVKIQSIHIPTQPIGTANLAADFLDKHVSSSKIRVCFDLDNTLVTYPSVPNDYTTVRPIQKNIEIARWARANGHTVIIYTARRMTTHKMNAGRVVADIGRLTFDTLDQFDIPYDELIFGKPIADVYIDDRAFNPYINSPRAMGLPFGDLSDTSTASLVNALPCNKYNTVGLANGLVTKKGPSSSISGEIFFYENVQGLPVASLFPAFHGSSKLPADPSMLQFKIDFIKGVPFTTIFRAQLLEEYHLRILVDAVHSLHTCAGVPTTLSPQEVGMSYLTKLQVRFSDTQVYEGLDEVPATLAAITCAMEAYVAEQGCVCAPIIHGDAWFANTILTSTNAVFMVDMRGRVGSTMTLNGDPLYDYAKLCQSLLGFDEIVFHLPRVPYAYRLGLIQSFASLLQEKKIRASHVLQVCTCLIAGSLHAYEDTFVRKGLWGLVQNLLKPSGEWVTALNFFL